jgi:hypothetical protein
VAEKTVVLTVDNLGEASALQRGTWDPAIPQGQDPSVVQALPWLLDELESQALTATFFVEAINCEINPQAVSEIAARGHELGIHGYSHEPWGDLGGDPALERQLLERCVDAFNSLELAADAFRPPGGAMTDQTALVLEEIGIGWYSPAADPPVAAFDGGLVSLPFAWELVDAFHLLDRFAPLREARGAPAAAADPAAVARGFMAALQAEWDGARVLVLHPFLMLDPLWRFGVEQVLARLAQLAGCGEVAVQAGGLLAADLLAGA